MKNLYLKNASMTAAAAVIAFTMQALPASATTVRETVTETGPGAATTHVTETTTQAPVTTTTKRVVTDSDMGETTVHTTVTTEQPAVTHTEKHWHSTEQAIVAPGARVFQVDAFDLNHDRILTRAEIGEVLFKMYDTDGNGVIDNIEYERAAVLTITPVEKETVVSYDFDGDGLADETHRTYETFMQDSLLARFDMNKNGLSPHEFTGRDFYHADVSHDKGVDLREWQGSYTASIDAENKERSRFNK